MRILNRPAAAWQPGARWQQTLYPFPQVILDNWQRARLAIQRTIGAVNTPPRLYCTEACSAS